MNLTISGYSTALFSTWYFVEELDVLFDVGDGISSTLLQKSRKIENVFVSHADRDHITGLLQFNQLNAREGFPIIHYPKNCGSFAPLEHFAKQFDTHVTGTIWKPIIEGEKIWIKPNIYVQAIRNNHVSAPVGIHKSFGYKVVSVKYKLNEDLLHLNPQEIKTIISEKGKAQTHTEIKTNLISYSGDTPCENFEHWANAEVLIHEATFLGGNEDASIKTHGNKHSQLNEVLKAVSQTSIKHLILGHFSSRYSDEQIDTQIKSLCKQYEIKIPVFRVLPGVAVKDILKREPVYS
jgi:ribonuclease Z